MLSFVFNESPLLYPLCTNALSKGAFHVSFSTQDVVLYNSNGKKLIQPEFTVDINKLNPTKSGLRIL